MRDGPPIGISVVCTFLKSFGYGEPQFDDQTKLVLFERVKSHGHQMPPVVTLDFPTENTGPEPGWTRDKIIDLITMLGSNIDGGKTLSALLQNKSLQ